MLMRLRVLPTLLLASFWVPLIAAQEANQAPPPNSGARDAGVTFEVASIKRNLADGPSRGHTEPGGRFTATGAPVLQFIRLAYNNWSPDRILNLPAWVTSERYDVVA